MTPRTLIAGIGNVFKGDDGFGVEVVRRLSMRPLPDDVELVDVGIRGLDFAYRLLESRHELIVLVDTVNRDRAPGTVYQIEPDLTSLDSLQIQTAASQAHDMNPANVLAWVRAMGGSLERVTLIGCEPLDLGGDEMKMGLSPVVNAAVERAIAMIEDLLSSRVHPFEGRGEQWNA